MSRRFAALAAVGVLCILFVSCYVTVPAYKWNFSMLEPTPSDKLVFSDEATNFVFAFGETEVGFEVENKTTIGIKINWDECSFVYPDGTSSRVIHSGVKLIDRNAPQAATVIPPSAKISDNLIPSENIYYISGEYGGWQYKKLFAGQDKTIWDGKEVVVYFPLEVNGAKKEYKFRFRISVAQNGTARVLRGME